MGDTVPFAAAEAWAERVLRPIVETEMEPRTLVNINFPALLFLIARWRPKLLTQRSN